MSLFTLVRHSPSPKRATLNFAAGLTALCPLLSLASTPIVPGGPVPLPTAPALATANAVDATASPNLLPEPARPADDFVDSLGIATHWNFRNTVYGRKWDSLRPLIGGLGIRIIRDAFDPRLEDLWRDYGIRAILVSTPQPKIEEGWWTKQTELWTSHRDAIAAIEGPNEVNGWAKHGLSYEGKGWPEGPRLFQADLYKHIKGCDATKSIPVISLSTAYRGTGREIAPVKGFDIVNAHSYAGGAMPSSSLDFIDPYLLVGYGATLAPLVATESGYHTCLGESKVIAGSQQGVSRQAHRKYIPRHYAEYFNAGHVWTVVYEFAAGRPNKAEDQDPEAAFGLLDPNGDPKPAYFALKDLIALLSESRWDASTTRWVRPAPFTPRALAFSLKNAPPSVHHTLLQRSNGTFQLLLWNEVPCFDLRAKSDVANPEVSLRLVLDEDAAEITITRLGPDAPKPLRHAGPVREVDLSVPDEVLVVNITPAATGTPKPLAAPTGFRSESTGTTIALAWPVRTGEAACWVVLNGRRMGPATRSDDGAEWRFKAERLMPDTTYPFQVFATARDGGVSPSTSASFATLATFPDLVVREVVVRPAEPKVGDSLSFEALVENIGNEATESGVTLGVKFGVAGKTVAWCDSVKQSIAPGEKVRCIANSGPAGRSTWVATSGTYAVNAQADDVNRIVESNEGNNQLKIIVGTGTAPDLVIREVKIHQPENDAKQPLTVEVTLANQGTEAVMPGDRIGASVFLVDTKPRKLLGYMISRESLPTGQTLVLRVTCEAILSAGKHAILIVADDVNRIPELDETNNTAEIEL